MSEKSLSEELKGYADGLRQDVERGVEYSKSAVRAVAGWIEQRSKQAAQLEAERDDYRNQYHMAEAKVLSRDALLEQLSEEQLTKDVAKAEAENELLRFHIDEAIHSLDHARAALLTGESDG